MGLLIRNANFPSPDLLQTRLGKFTDSSFLLAVGTLPTLVHILVMPKVM